MKLSQLKVTLTTQLVDVLFDVNLVIKNTTRLRAPVGGLTLDSSIDNEDITNVQCLYLDAIHIHSVLSLLSFSLLRRIHSYISKQTEKASNYLVTSSVLKKKYTWVSSA